MVIMYIEMINNEEFEFIFKFNSEYCRGYIAIHDITLGNPTGGTRIWAYEKEEDALLDALKLAKAMTYKFGFTSIMLGGGKAVIFDESKNRRKVMQDYGRILRNINNYLKKEVGKIFITGEDLGIKSEDIENILKTSKSEYIVGIDNALGPPSKLTAKYVKECMKVCAFRKFGTSSLKDLKIAIQGAGKVGEELIRQIINEKSKIFVADINPKVIENIRDKYPNVYVYDSYDTERIMEEECDIFAPCAVGGVIDKDLLNKTNCSIICGAANNPLKEDKIAEYMHKQGVLYAPDFCVNCAGAIGVGVEALCKEARKPYDEIFANNELKQIVPRLNHLLYLSEQLNISPLQIAYKIVEEKIKILKELKKQ